MAWVLGAFDFGYEVVEDDGGVGGVLEFGGEGVGEGDGFNGFANGLDGSDGVGEVFITRDEKGSVVAVLMGKEEHIGDKHDINTLLEGRFVVLSEGEGLNLNAQVVEFGEESVLFGGVGGCPIIIGLHQVSRSGQFTD